MQLAAGVSGKGPAVLSGPARGKGALGARCSVACKWRPTAAGLKTELVRDPFIYGAAVAIRLDRSVGEVVRRAR